MLENAKKKMHYASRLIRLLTSKLNARGLHMEQQKYGLNRQRIVGIRLTDQDIREAEKRHILPQKVWKFYLSPSGQLLKVNDRDRKSDVLMYLTFHTFYELLTGQMSVQEAYRLREIQIRYMKGIDRQEDDFLRDAGLVLKLMNKIQDEMVKDGPIVS